MPLVDPIANALAESPLGDPIASPGLPWEPSGGGNAPLTPLTIFGTSLFMWQRADYANITDAGSGRVSQWNDLSGKGNHLVQETAADQPLWVDAVVSGKPVIRFTRANTEFLACATMDATHSQRLSWFFVVRPTTSATSRNLFATVNVSPSQVISIANTHVFVANAGAAINGVTAFSNAWAAICVDFNGASSRIYANNFTTADSAGNAGTGAIDSVKIGQSQAGTNSLDADIAEFFGVDGAVSQAARDAARDYINARYAIGVA